VADTVIVAPPEKVKFLFRPSEARRAELQRTYSRLMERANGRLKTGGKYELHHIVPRSLGGTNDPQNCVYLTYKEHFLAHWLLTRITDGRARLQMLKAIQSMTGVSVRNKRAPIASWVYELARISQYEAMLGNTYGKGYKHTEEWKVSMRGNTYANGTKNFKGKCHTNEWKLAASLRMMGNQNAKGCKRSVEYILARSGANSLKARAVRCIDDGLTFRTIKEAKEYYGNTPEISAVCRGKQKTTGGLRFEYIEKFDAE
jgi:hypothetical protein